MEKADELVAIRNGGDYGSLECGGVGERGPERWEQGGNVLLAAL